MERAPVSRYRRPWIAAVQKGLILGGVAVFLALVGMVETFAGRQIIVGVISLGLALPVLTALVAGYQGAQGQAGGAHGAPRKSVV